MPRRGGKSLRGEFSCALHFPPDQFSSLPLMVMYIQLYKLYQAYYKNFHWRRRKVCLRCSKTLAKQSTQYLAFFLWESLIRMELSKAPPGKFIKLSSKKWKLFRLKWDILNNLIFFISIYKFSWCKKYHRKKNIFYE